MAASPAEVIRPLRRVEYDLLVKLGVFGRERVDQPEKYVPGQVICLSAFPEVGIRVSDVFLPERA